LAVADDVPLLGPAQPQVDREVIRREGQGVEAPAKVIACRGQ